MHNYRWWSVFSNGVVSVLALLCASSALAAVNIDRTRVIFSASDMTQSLNLSNDSETPMLIQVWADNGDPHSTPDINRTPIVAIPPVFKMLPGELRALKLILTSRQTLPTDKESLFWLNIYQIAPGTPASQAEEAKVMLPLRLRMKMIIRPAALKAPHEGDEQKLRFSRTGNGVHIDNPTPWFMSLSLHVNGEQKPVSTMVDPHATLDIPLSVPITPGETLHYDVTTDDGNYRQYQAVIH